MLLNSIPRLILVKSVRIRPDEPVSQGYSNQYNMTRLMAGCTCHDDVDHQTPAEDSAKTDVKFPGHRFIVPQDFELAQ
jgi:hypothetical protein